MSKPNDPESSPEPVLTAKLTHRRKSGFFLLNWTGALLAGIGWVLGWLIAPLVWLFAKVWHFLVAVFTVIGRFELWLTTPRWMRGSAPWLYVLGFSGLSLVPGWLDFAPALQLGWAGLMFVFGMGLIAVYFRHDTEADAARRGLLIGRGNFVNAIVTGEEDDPQLRLVSQYPKRLGLVTLFAAGLALTLSFALLCEGLFHSGFQHWYRMEGSEVPIVEMDLHFSHWALYAGLSVFRALDLFDTMPTFRYDPPLLRHEGWDVGWTAPGMCFAFKFMFDLFLLAKLRSLLGSFFLYRQVKARTLETPAEDRDKVRRSLSGTLLATGDFFINRFLGGRGQHNKDLTIFARDIIQGAGVHARIELGHTVLEELEAASGEERNPILEKLGELDLRPGDFNSAHSNRAETLPTVRFGASWQNAVGMSFMAIEPGTFQMGSDGGRDDNEKPVHQVTLTEGFWMSSFALTQGEFITLTGFNPSISKWAGDRAPVDTLSWHHAQAFCVWLTLRHWEADLLPRNWEYRLPTEAQWEYACRAGSTTEWFFGDDEAQLGDYAWFSDNAQLAGYPSLSDSLVIHPVGEKKPNAWGLYDMYGNVIEWCQSWEGPYPEKVVEDPQGPALGSKRAARGGCFRNNPSSCRSACRIAYPPSILCSGWGLRPCVVPSITVQ